MTRTSRAISFITLIFVCLTAACSGAAPKTAAEPLKIAYSLWQGDYTLLIGIKAGIFANYGIDVQPFRYDSAPTAITDLAGLKLDGGIFSMSDFILATNLAHIKGVLVSDNGGEWSVVGMQDINKVTDLRGKRIGLNYHTSSEVFTTNMLKTGRMSYIDVTYVEMPPSSIPNGVPNAIAAGVVREPYTTLAVKQGQKIIYQNADFSALLPNVLAFRTAVINQDPDRIRKFLQAWNEAVNYRLKNPNEADAIIAKATSLTADEVKISKGTKLYTTQDNIQLFSVNPEKDPTSIYHIAEANRDFLVTYGYITFPPDLQSLLDPSYLK